MSNSSPYNARVVSIRSVHDSLRILRIAGGDFVPNVVPGQYTTLGLGNWERRVDSLEPAVERRRLVQCAYSVSSPLINDRGELAGIGEDGWLEFYVALVPSNDDDPPPLTPRLFACEVGAPCHMGPTPHGRYSVESVRSTDNVVLCATGTGEAPHNAMVVELLRRQHAGQIVSIVCVRNGRDLAYLEAHRELERRFPSYHYLTLRTREPRNTDESRPDYVGKQYIQDLFLGSDLTASLGFEPDPNDTHMYLCGSPAMIAGSRHPSDEVSSPGREGMTEVLVRMGFRLDAPRSPGNVHFEKYW